MYHYIPQATYPNLGAGHTYKRFLFGLAPRGVYHAVFVAKNAVRSYRTFSPLPNCKTIRRYIFCGTFRRLAPPRRYLALYPVEPGLSSQACLVLERLSNQPREGE